MSKQLNNSQFLPTAGRRNTQSDNQLIYLFTNKMDRKVYEFISKKMQDPILERRTCEITGQEFPIFQGDKDLLDKLSPVIVGKKYSLPLPKLCPEERQRRRMGADNLTNLYKRKCDFSGKMVISRFRPEIPMKIYEQKIRWSDQRDGLQYGRQMDFTRSFFDQLKELYYDVPKFNVTSNFLLDKNSDYTNYAGSNKNCYFTFGADFNEDCYYDLYIKGCKNCVGNFYIFDSEHCYGNTDISKSFNVMYSRNCQQCRHSYFLENCINCEFCIGCKNLVNQKYCIRNKQATKEEYDAYIKQYFLGSKVKRDEFQKKFQEFSLQYPNRATTCVQTENSVGNFLYNTKNSLCCFDMRETENARYCYSMTMGPNKNCMDVSSFGIGIERIYNSGSIGYNVQNTRFSEQVNENCSDVFYSRELFYCHNCFGCVGLKNKEYCILNVQYTQQEYEKLVPQIIEYLMKIEERGDFFPMASGPFAYNELVTNAYFPLTKEEVLRRGLTWLDEKPEINIPENIQRIHAGELPENVNDADDDILKKIILCEVSGRPFILQKGELDFYRQHTIPLPTKHPDIRFHEGIGARPGKSLYPRICDHCQQETVSVYSEESGYKIYCESCYNKEIYG